MCRSLLVIKLNSGTSVFMWILRSFQEYLLYITPLNDCFCLIEGVGGNSINYANLKSNEFSINVESKAFVIINPAGIYLLKGNNRSTRTRCETCSELTIKKQNGAIGVNFEHISPLVLEFQFWTLNM